MVLLWPWKGDDTSPASFEKSLSTLSTKITKASTNLELCRGRARRFKALWTLYTSFAYLLYLMIMALVLGWRHWGALEYTSLAGGPLVIYVVRLALTTFYDYRITNIQAYLDTLQKQRDKTIDKLKAATKYNTTQQLLEKYGGSPPTKPGTEVASKNKSSPISVNSNSHKVGRTGYAPPPTANIPGRMIAASVPNTPHRVAPSISPTGVTPPLTAAAASAPWQHSSSHLAADTAEFAPNAFPTTSQYVPVAAGGPKWYDRIMDVLLGDDESLPKNRLVLICKTCRLVNGQAPPGVKSLEDVGKWRCSSCGTMNGEESEAKKLVAELKEQKTMGQRLNDSVLSASDGHVVSDKDEVDQMKVEPKDEDENDSVENEPEPAEPEPTKHKRGRPKGSGNKKT